MIKNQIPTPVLLREGFPGHSSLLSLGCAYWLCTSPRNDSGIIHVEVKITRRDTCAPSFSHQTSTTMNPKILAFPQKSPAKRRRRPMPGATQRGACLPQRFHSPDRKTVSDRSHQDCTPRHSLCPLLEPKPHVRTLKVKGRGVAGSF